MKTQGGNTQWTNFKRAVILIMATLAVVGGFALNTHDATEADTAEQAVVVTEGTPETDSSATSEAERSSTSESTIEAPTSENDETAKTEAETIVESHPETESSTATNDEATTEKAPASKDSATTTNETKKIEADATKEVFKAEASPKSQQIPSGGSVYADHRDLANNTLGIPSQFHIFAYEASLHTHTAGNLAVASLNGLVDFGTTNKLELLDRDITYIQKIIKIASSSFVSAGNIRDNKVIFGEGITIDISDPKRPIVADTYIDHLLASEVYQDQPGETYIDFPAEFAKLAGINTSLSQRTPNASYVNADFKDENNRTIDVRQMTPDAAGQIIINLAADVLNKDRPLIIKGVSPEATGNTIIFNVNTDGQSNYLSRSEMKVTYPDGSVRANKDADAYGDNHLLWNFHNNQQTFTGTINVNSRFQGSVLAPSATLIANQNMDGNLIAKRVEVHGETHRWDLQDNTGPEDEDKPDPVEEEEEDIDVPVDPEPEDPEPEDPEPEDPDPEDPDPEDPEPEEPEPEDPDPEDPDPEDPEPETPEPETPEPETPEPETPEPETPEPETPEPETPEPETPEPEEPDPETPEPETPEPETPEPETPEPETPEPETPEPETPEPETPEPEMPEPDPTDPEPENETNVNEPNLEDPVIIDELDAPITETETPTNGTETPITSKPYFKVATNSSKIVTQLERRLDTALALPAPQRTVAVKQVLRQIDTAIVQAHKTNAVIRATKLEALRARSLAVLHTGQLPQTDERQTETMTAIGLGLTVITLATGWGIIKRRRRHS
ncbi:collagen-binding domain-containing protein [Lactiplantibacillus nangangensis]|uniref:collagen-binding domain-containing protein n=1 Tax=Lactiplantibacillus nangangensis TaxID=2559917 RepID=UPI0010F63226|nr:collagen-binding domain-containing protein [Lactiplantibacillus nangangensis]